MVTVIAPSAYEALQIEVEIDLLESGEYNFQADLYGEKSDVTSESLISSFYSAKKARLGKGKNTLVSVFSGKDIVKRNIFGKYRLRNLLVYKPGKSSPFFENVLTTEAFTREQFEPES